MINKKISILLVIIIIIVFLFVAFKGFERLGSSKEKIPDNIEQTTITTTGWPDNLSISDEIGG